MNSAWELKLENNKIIRETDIPFWDALPIDIIVLHAAFTSPDGKKFIFSNFNKICIAKIGSCGLEGKSNFIGYAITEIKDDIFLTRTMKKDSIESFCGNIKDITIPMSCFRRGSKKSISEIEG